MNKSIIMPSAHPHLDLTKIDKPLIMAILNVTPDSFSDGGRFNQLDQALRHAETMLNNGADIIDIGGESTRPGAAAVTLEQELARVIPVIDKLKSEFGCLVSLDTSKPEVMTEGIALGVDLINDVCALTQGDAVEVVARSNVPVCLMHMKGSPRTMQSAPVYNDVVHDVKAFLDNRVQICQTAGIDKSRICIDPGFGFGKTLQQNYQMLQRLDEFQSLGMPVLAGLSRKSMIGNLLNLAADARVLGSVVCATLALTKGAKILRVHDVAETKQAVDLFNATNYGVDNE